MFTFIKICLDVKLATDTNEKYWDSVGNRVFQVIFLRDSCCIWAMDQKLIDLLHFAT